MQINHFKTAKVPAIQNLRIKLPAFIAYRLNGAPIPLERGGPVRMVIPWAHGFKSIKSIVKIELVGSRFVRTVVKTGLLPSQARALASRLNDERDTGHEDAAHEAASDVSYVVEK